MDGDDHVFHDRTPGVEEREPTASYLTYTVGLALAILTTIGSFIVSQTDLLWPPGIPVGLVVLAFAQIGVHLVFFLHLGSGSDNTNNILALAFGVLVVFLVIAGSIWIISNLAENMTPMHSAAKGHVTSARPLPCRTRVSAAPSFARLLDNG